MAGASVRCSFSSWNAAGSTDKDGDYQMASYGLEVDGARSGQLGLSQGGPDAGYSEAPISPATYNDQTSFLEVHLTSTGADLVFAGTIVHTIDQVPADSAYRFGCATHQQNAGYSDLEYLTAGFGHSGLVVWYGMEESPPTPLHIRAAPSTTLAVVGAAADAWRSSAASAAASWGSTWAESEPFDRVEMKEGVQSWLGAAPHTYTSVPPSLVMGVLFRGVIRWQTPWVCHDTHTTFSPCDSSTPQPSEWDGYVGPHSSTGGSPSTLMSPSMSKTDQPTTIPVGAIASFTSADIRPGRLYVFYDARPGHSGGWGVTLPADGWTSEGPGPSWRDVNKDAQCSGVALDGTPGPCLTAGWPYEDCGYTLHRPEVFEACTATATDACAAVDISGDYSFGRTDTTGYEEACAAIARDICSDADISGNQYLSKIVCEEASPDSTSTCMYTHEVVEVQESCVAAQAASCSTVVLNEATVDADCTGAGQVELGRRCIFTAANATAGTAESCFADSAKNCTAAAGSASTCTALGTCTYTAPVAAVTEACTATDLAVCSAADISMPNMTLSQQACEAAGACAYWASSRTLCEASAGGSCTYTAQNASGAVVEACAATHHDMCSGVDLSTNASASESACICADNGICTYTVARQPIAEACHGVSHPMAMFSKVLAPGGTVALPETTTAVVMATVLQSKATVGRIQAPWSQEPCGDGSYCLQTRTCERVAQELGAADLPADCRSPVPDIDYILNFTSTFAAGSAARIQFMYIMIGTDAGRLFLELAPAGSAVDSNAWAAIWAKTGTMHATSYWMNATVDIAPSADTIARIRARPNQAVSEIWLDDVRQAPRDLLPAHSSHQTSSCNGVDLGGQTTRTTCADCIAGRYINVSGTGASGSCTACLGGRFSSVVGSSAYTDCKVCGAGKYSELLSGSTGCIECVAGKYVQDSCLNLGPGFVICNGHCVPGCSGRHMPWRDEPSDCRSCLAGRYYGSTGSHDLSNCIQCTVGKYSDTVASATEGNCISCSAGKWLNVSGAGHATDCIDCAMGRFSIFPGSKAVEECTSCATGKYLATPGSISPDACIACGMGKFNDVPGSNSEDDCKECAAGKYVDLTGSTQDTDCINCGLGKFLDVAGSSWEYDCILCSKGRYSAAVGSPTIAACIGCLAGQYGVATGSISDALCIMCPAGTYVRIEGSDNITDCVDCVPGRFSNETGNKHPRDCTQCPLGTYTVNSRSLAEADCIPCELGRFIDGRSYHCLACTAGKWVGEMGSDSESDCIDCIPGTALSVSGSDSNADCLACERGKYAPEPGTVLCTDCAAGQYSEGTILVDSEEFEEWGNPQGSGTIWKDSERGTSAWVAVTVTDAQNGNHLLRASLAGQSEPQNVTLNFTMALEAGSSARFRFWYRMASNDPGELSFELASEIDETWVAMWTQNDSTGSVWTLATVDVVVAVASVGRICARPTGNGNIDIDDLQVYYPGWACIDCIAGKISTVVGSSYEANCTNCSAGEYSLPGLDSCIVCPIDTVAPIDALPGCDICDPNTGTNFSRGAFECSCNNGYDMDCGECGAFTKQGPAWSISNSATMSAEACTVNFLELSAGLSCEAIHTAPLCGETISKGDCVPDYQKPSSLVCRNCLKTGSCIDYPPEIQFTSIPTTNPLPDIPELAGKGWKGNPSSRFVIRSSVTIIADADRDKVVEKSWQAWRNLTTDRAGNQGEALDLLAPGVLSSTTTGPNLVIRPNVLRAGATYLVRLTASIVGGLSAQEEIFFTMNSPPTLSRGGGVSVEPSSGMTLNVSFAMTIAGFNDDPGDLPLRYRFGHDAGQSRTWLTSNIPSENRSYTTTAVLPQGTDADDFVYLLVGLCSDIYMAGTEVVTNVTVFPFEKPDTVTWADAVGDMIGNETMSVEQASQLLTGVATGLNQIDATDDAMKEELKDARTSMVNALEDSLGTLSGFGAATDSDATDGEAPPPPPPLDEDAVEQFASTLASLTSAPDQLSSDTVSTAMNVLSAITTRSEGVPPPPMGSAAATSIALTAGSLFMASVPVPPPPPPPPAPVSATDQNRTAAEGETSVAPPQINETAEADRLDRERDAAADQAAQMMDVLSSISASVAGSMVPGEDPVAIETGAFAMQIAAVDTSVGGSIGGGLAELPSNISQLDGEVGTQAIAWTLNPFSFADPSPAGEDDKGTELSSKVSTLSLISSATGREVNVSGMDPEAPVIIIISTAGVENQWTDDGAVSCDDKCVNTFDIGQNDHSACDKLVHEEGYSCILDFCYESDRGPCSLAGYCDRSCGLVNCANGTNTTMDDQEEDLDYGNLEPIDVTSSWWRNLTWWSASWSENATCSNWVNTAICSNWSNYTSACLAWSNNATCSTFINSSVVCSGWSHNASCSAWVNASDSNSTACTEWSNAAVCSSWFADNSTAACMRWVNSSICSGWFGNITNDTAAFNAIDIDSSINATNASCANWSNTLTCVAQRNATENATVPNCTLAAEPKCTFWDVRTRQWRLDGVIISQTKDEMTCAFTHLTDFAGMLGPAPQTQQLGSLNQTFDLAAFARDNLLGLLVSLGMFVILCMCGCDSIKKYRRRNKSEGVDLSHITESQFIKSHHSLTGAWSLSHLSTHMRTKYTCGALWFPLNGDPMVYPERALVIVCTVLVTMAVDLYFFDAGGTTNEMCEGPETTDWRGRVIPANCTADTEAFKQDRCTCITFLCSLNAPCNGCEDCTGSIDECLTMCDEFVPSGGYAAFVASFVSSPLIFVLNLFFTWLHKPFKSAMADALASLSKERREAAEAEALALKEDADVVAAKAMLNLVKLNGDIEAIRAAERVLEKEQAEADDARARAIIERQEADDAAKKVVELDRASHALKDGGSFHGREGLRSRGGSFKGKKVKNEKKEKKEKELQSRRSAAAALLTYSVACVLGLAAVLITMSISRVLSPGLTMQWFKSAVYSLILKWAFVDPLKVAALSPIMAYLSTKTWGGHINQVLRCCCVDKKVEKNAKFKGSVRKMMMMRAKMQAIQQSTLKEMTRDEIAKMQEEMRLAHAKELDSIPARLAGVRWHTMAKHRKQREELDRKEKELHENLKSVITGEGEDFAGMGGADADGATKLMNKFNSKLDNIGKPTAPTAKVMSVGTVMSLGKMKGKFAEKRAEKARAAEIADLKEAQRRIMAEKILAMQSFLNQHSAQANSIVASPDGDPDAVVVDSAKGKNLWKNNVNKLMGGAPGASAARTRDVLRQAFDALDEDKGGTLDRDEICQLYKNLGSKLSELEVDALMKHMDDDDSAVDFEEFYEYYTKGAKAAQIMGDKKPQKSAGPKQYTVLGKKAVVRVGPDPNSNKVDVVVGGTIVTAIEELVHDGQTRLCIGKDRWMSLKTAKGKVLMDEHVPPKPTTPPPKVVPTPPEGPKKATGRWGVARKKIVPKLDETIENTQAEMLRKVAIENMMRNEKDLAEAQSKELEAIPARLAGVRWHTLAKHKQQKADLKDRADELKGNIDAVLSGEITAGSQLAAMAGVQSNEGSSVLMDDFNQKMDSLAKAKKDDAAGKSAAGKIMSIAGKMKAKKEAKAREEEMERIKEEQRRIMAEKIMALQSFLDQHQDAVEDIKADRTAGKPVTITRDAMKRAFKEMDKDGGGLLDREEIRALCKNLGSEPSESELDDMMKNMDSDGSGEVDFEEFVKWFNPAALSGKDALTYIGSGKKAAGSWLDRTRMKTGKQYKVLGKKAVVRAGADPNSDKADIVMGGTIVRALEETIVDGHTRIRVGKGRWMSRMTAKGKVLMEEYTEPVPLEPTPVAAKAGGKKVGWGQVKASVKPKPRPVDEGLWASAMQAATTEAEPQKAEWGSNKKESRKQYKVLGKKTVVRAGAHPDSDKVDEVKGGTIVTALEETIVDGHTRVRTGKDRWMSRMTAKGKLLMEEVDAVPEEILPEEIKYVDAASPKPKKLGWGRVKEKIAVKQDKPEKVKRNKWAAAIINGAEANAAGESPPGSSVNDPELEATATPGRGSKKKAPEAPIKQYTVLGKKAVVRASADPNSDKVDQVMGGATVTAMDERVVDGHTRILIGKDRWMSRMTAKGKVLMEEVAQPERLLPRPPDAGAAKPSQWGKFQDSAQQAAPSPKTAAAKNRWTATVDGTKAQGAGGGATWGRPLYDPQPPKEDEVQGVEAAAQHPESPKKKKSKGKTDKQQPTQEQIKQYKVLGKKAVVRAGADPNSDKVDEVMGGTIVTALEEAVVDGHTRVRTGKDRWMSRTTAKGKVLLEPLE